LGQTIKQFAVATILAEVKMPASTVVTGKQENIKSGWAVSNLEPEIITDFLCRNSSKFPY
jgi:hypothetical protein